MRRQVSAYLGNMVTGLCRGDLWTHNAGQELRRHQVWPLHWKLQTAAHQAVVRMVWAFVRDVDGESTSIRWHCQQWAVNKVATSAQRRGGPADHETIRVGGEDEQARIQ